MSNLILRTLDRFTKPDTSTLIGAWSSKRHRNAVPVLCIFHQDGETHILNQSDKYVHLPNEDYLDKLKQGGATSYNPKTYTFDSTNPEYVIKEGTDAHKFFLKYPNATIDGKSNGKNPHVHIVNEAVMDETNLAGIRLKIKVENFITGLNMEEMKEVCYFFGNTPKDNSNKILLQLIGEKEGLLWKKDMNGSLLANEVERVFIDKDKDVKGNVAKETNIKITCNKAITFGVISFRGSIGKPGAYYWGDKFIDATQEGLYAYFRNEDRFFESLKNEITRVTGETQKDSSILKSGVSVNPSRNILWDELQALAKEGFADVTGLVYAKTNKETIEKLLAEAKSKKEQAVV